MQKISAGNQKEIPGGYIREREIKEDI